MRPEDAAIYEKHADELVRFAGVLVGPGAAEDLFVTAFLRAAATPRWTEIVNHRAYLYRVLINEAHRQRRSHERRLAREQRAAGRDRHEASFTDVDVLGALAALTVRQRAIVHLTYWLDRAAPDVARSMGLSLRTVERELAAARRILEERL